MLYPCGKSIPSWSGWLEDSRHQRRRLRANLAAPGLHRLQVSSWPLIWLNYWLQLTTIHCSGECSIFFLVWDWSQTTNIFHFLKFSRSKFGVWTFSCFLASSGAFVMPSRSRCPISYHAWCATMTMTPSISHGNGSTAFRAKYLRHCRNFRVFLFQHDWGPATLKTRCRINTSQSFCHVIHGRVICQVAINPSFEK